ncbi:acyltransferase [Caballeronia novacaledonica]|uniref:Acyltransferase n=1 Tax=Caballeronia novacaledonica TaxID=1544861 RepID=A0AA37MJU5_9BURK|nr:hypothetical protein [Caballeronia novacaledonica]GJH30555.1 hypothetical protein CBA19CS42_38585 [Caballeronia novacaledonica]
MLSSMALVLVYVAHLTHAVVLNFLFGIAAAMIEARRPRIARVLTGTAATSIALVALCATAFPLAEDYGVAQSLLIFPLFMCVCYGNSIFGLLSRPSAQVLGLVSYGVYLNHGVLLYAGLQFANRWFPIAQMNTFMYGATMLSIGVSITLLSMLTYRFVESPFMTRHRRAPFVSRVAEV